MIKIIDLAKLKVTITTDAEKAKQELNDVGDTAQKQESKFSKFGSALKTGATIGVTAVAGLATGLAKMATGTAETAKEIDRLSQQTGMSTTAYQEWDYVMQQLGYSMEQAAGDFSALGEKAMDAANETGEGAELFGLLGVAVTDTTGKMKSQEQIFSETITALQGMEDVTQRNAIASALLGTTGEELTSILNMTGTEVDAMKQKAHDLGAVMSKESIDASVKFGNSLGDLKASFGGVVAELGVAFMPLLQNLADWTIAHMPEIKKTMEVVFGAVKIAVDIAGKSFNAILPILVALYEWIEPYFPAIQNIVETTFGAIGKAVQIVTDIFWGVVDAIKAAISWLSSWNNTEAKDKNTSFKSGRDYDGSHKDGLDYVPYDGYRSVLHEGEAILTAQQADIWRNNTNNNINISGNNFVIREEADITKMGRELQRQITRKQRGTATA